MSPHASVLQGTNTPSGSGSEVTLLRSAAQRSDRFFGLFLAAHLLLALALAPVMGTWGPALLLGGLLSGTAYGVTRLAPGTLLSMVTVATSMMGYSALIIHQSGGMIEMHFHIFASLAFLLMYRDWRAPVVGAAVIAVHHVVVHALQSAGLPVYVFPVGHAHSWWRVWIHAAFVVYETIVLFFLARTLAREARQAETLVSVARRMGEGDLSLAVEAGDGPVGAALDALGVGTGQVANMIRVIRERAANMAGLARTLETAADRMGEASRGVEDRAGAVRDGVRSQLASVEVTEEAVTRLRSAIDQVSSGSRTQAGQTRHVSDTLEEMVRSVDRVNSLAQSVSERSSEAGRAAEEGSKVVERTAQGMQRIRESVLVSARQIEELETRSAQIESILKDLADIADQTNLLALNATIEAARAGEHGKGFAVVASEVRELAKRADRSGEEIAARLKLIREGTADAVQSMEACTTEVEQGARLAAEAGSALSEILRAVNDTVRDVQTIRGSAEALTETGDVVRAGVQSVSQVTEDSTSAAMEMDAGSDQVRRAIADIIALSRENDGSADAMSSSVAEIGGAVGSLRESAAGLSTIALELEHEVARFKV